MVLRRGSPARPKGRWRTFTSRSITENDRDSVTRDMTQRTCNKPRNCAQKWRRCPCMWTEPSGRRLPQSTWTCWTQQRSKCCASECARRPRRCAVPAGQGGRQQRHIRPYEMCLRRVALRGGRHARGEAAADLQRDTQGAMLDAGRDGGHRCLRRRGAEKVARGELGMFALRALLGGWTAAIDRVYSPVFSLRCTRSIRCLCSSARA